MLGMYLKYAWHVSEIYIFGKYIIHFSFLFKFYLQLKIRKNQGNFHFLIRTFRKLDVTPDNLSCRTENDRSAVADLLVSAAPPTPFPKQFAGSQTFDQSMLAYQCQSYSALARLRIGMRTQLAMPDPHGMLAYQCQSYSALARLRIGMRTQLAMPDPHGHLAHQYTIKI